MTHQHTVLLLWSNVLRLFVLDCFFVVLSFSVCPCVCLLVKTLSSDSTKTSEQMSVLWLALWSRTMPFVPKKMLTRGETHHRRKQNEKHKIRFFRLQLILTPCIYVCLSVCSSSVPSAHDPSCMTKSTSLPKKPANPSQELGHSIQTRSYRKKWCHTVNRTTQPAELSHRKKRNKEFTLES